MEWPHDCPLFQNSTLAGVYKLLLRLLESMGLCISSLRRMETLLFPIVLNERMDWQCVFPPSIIAFKISYGWSQTTQTSWCVNWLGYLYLSSFKGIYFTWRTDSHRTTRSSVSYSFVNTLYLYFLLFQNSTLKIMSRCKKRLASELNGLVLESTSRCLQVTTKILQT